MNPDRLSSEADVDPLGYRAVSQLLEDECCSSCDYRVSIESTNSLALSSLSGLRPETDLPRLYLADHQTAGRGRHGRTWHSNDETLTFSLLLNRAPDITSTSLTPLAVGLGLASFLEFEFAPQRALLKWPNDVHVGGGKVAGILMETTSSSPEQLVVGIGINVGETPQLESPSATQSARSLSQVLGRKLRRYDLLGGVVRHILDSVSIAQSDSRNLIVEYRSRCLLTGKEIEYTDRGVRTRGTCMGISESGALIVKVGTEERLLHSGETNLVRPKS